MEIDGESPQLFQLNETDFHVLYESTGLAIAEILGQLSSFLNHSTSSELKDQSLKYSAYSNTNQDPRFFFKLFIDNWELWKLKLSNSILSSLTQLKLLTSQRAHSTTQQDLFLEFFYHSEKLLNELERIPQISALVKEKKDLLNLSSVKPATQDVWLNMAHPTPLFIQINKKSVKDWTGSDETLPGPLIDDIILIFDLSLSMKLRYTRSTESHLVFLVEGCLVRNAVNFLSDPLFRVFFRGEPLDLHLIETCRFLVVQESLSDSQRPSHNLFDSNEVLFCSPPQTHPPSFLVFVDQLKKQEFFDRVTGSDPNIKRQISISDLKEDRFFIAYGPESSSVLHGPLIPQDNQSQKPVEVIYSMPLNSISSGVLVVLSSPLPVSTEFRGFKLLSFCSRQLMVEMFGVPKTISFDILKNSWKSLVGVYHDTSRFRKLFVFDPTLSASSPFDPNSDDLSKSYLKLLNLDSQSSQDISTLFLYTSLDGLPAGFLKRRLAKVLTRTPSTVHWIDRGLLRIIVEGPVKVRRKKFAINGKLVKIVSSYIFTPPQVYFLSKKRRHIMEAIEKQHRVKIHTETDVNYLRVEPLSCDPPLEQQKNRESAIDSLRDVLKDFNSHTVELEKPEFRYISNRIRSPPFLSDDFELLLFCEVAPKGNRHALFILGVGGEFFSCKKQIIEMSRRVKSIYFSMEKKDTRAIMNAIDEVERKFDHAVTIVSKELPDESKLEIYILSSEDSLLTLAKDSLVNSVDLQKLERLSISHSFSGFFTPIPTKSTLSTSLPSNSPPQNSQKVRSL